RGLSADLGHQLVDILELAQRYRPRGVARAPAAPRPHPDGERLGEILVGMTLRVPESQVLDMLLARRVRPILIGIRLGRAPEEVAPPASVVQAIGVLNRVSGFVPQNAHALAVRAAFQIQHLRALETHETRVSEVEWRGESRYAQRRKPFIGEPDVRLQHERPVEELAPQLVDLRPEP